MAGRSTVPFDHPNLIFGFGVGGDAVRRESDVVIVAGSRLGNLDLPFDKYWGDPVEQRIIQIDIDPRNIGVTRPITLGIVADVKAALGGLAGLLRNEHARPKDGLDLARYRQLTQAWVDEQFRVLDGWSGPAIHPVQVVQAVGNIFGKEAIYFADGGNTSLWTHWFSPPTAHRSYHCLLELGMLGFDPSSNRSKVGQSRP
jgi:acetolactate synthase-1/2/3 large subunit